MRCHLPSSLVKTLWCSGLTIDARLLLSVILSPHNVSTDHTGSGSGSSSSARSSSESDDKFLFLFGLVDGGWELASTLGSK